ncbi:serine/threonine protein kinase, partial [Streptomyces sp. NPDC003674]
GAPRPGSARHRAAVRRRRITLGVAGVVLAAAVGVGAWAATSGDEPPADTHSTSTP